MPFLAGATGGRIGGSRSLVLFYTICLMGVLLCTIAVMRASWPLLTKGRLGFGLGVKVLIYPIKTFWGPAYHEVKLAQRCDCHGE